MKPYSLDLRQRIVEAVGQGKTYEEVAHLFHVSPSTVKRYIRQWREEGNLQPRPIPGRPAKKLALVQDGLLSQIEAFPDATLEERCKQWEEQNGTKVSISTMSRAINVLMEMNDKKQWKEDRGRVDEGKKRNKSKKKVHDKKESSVAYSQETSAPSVLGRMSVYVSGLISGWKKAWFLKERHSF